MINFRNKWVFISLLTFLWFILALVVNPLGEFPLNDDWSYCRNVYDLAVHGILRFNDWTAITLIAQTLWGTLFCKIFGFSFTVLRISVLIAGWGGMIAFYLLLRRMVMNEVLAFWFTLMLTFNPLYFSLSYTFMTDVPFIASILCASWFYFRYYEEERIRYLFYATSFALIATLIRQLGIAIVVAAFLTCFLTGKIRLKQVLLQLFLTCFLISVLYLLTSHLIQGNLVPSGKTSLGDLINSFTPSRFIRHIYYRGGILLFYTGLLLLPLVISILPSYLKSTKPLTACIALVVSLPVCIPAILNAQYLPIGNIINNLGLGPKLLKDAFWELNRHPMLSPGILQVICVTGAIGAVLLMFTFILSLLRLNSEARKTPSGKIKIQILLMMGGYMCFVLLFAFFFDRYFLPAIFFFILILISAEIKLKKGTLAFSVLLFLCIAFFSVSATHDYLSFNRARWTGLRSLMAKGISPHHIDGGFEFNGWYATGQREAIILKNKSWWWVDDDTYLFALGNVCGYRELSACRYNSFLTFSPDSVLILKRSSLYRDSTVISCGAEALAKDGNHFATSVDTIEFGATYLRTDAGAHEGKYSILLDTIHPYGFTIHFTHVEPCEKYRVTVWCKDNTDHKAGIVIAGPEADWLYVWSTLPKKREGDWELLEAETSLYLGYPSSKVSVFLWNTGKGKVLFDDLTITRYQHPVF